MTLSPPIGTEISDLDKIIILTDVHLRAGGKTIIGLDPLARFDEAYQAAITAQPNAKALIIMGDLTHSGHAEEYEALRGRIADCPIPVTLMLGNHDTRAHFIDAFPGAPCTDAGHVQRIIDLPKHRIITLDTHDSAADPLHSGFLCADRLAWLDAALAGCEGRQPLVFAHHPPCPVGFPAMDGIPLRNGADLLDRLRGTGAHLFFGHIHRTISGQAGGVPFTCFKGTCHQMPFDLTGFDSTASTDEPAAYGLLLLTDSGVIAHSEDIGLDAQVLTGADALPDH